jgi:outer membrane murein-binding lipoprotein Lpp
MTVMKSSHVFIAAGFGALWLVGCVPTADFTDLRDDVREIQAENKKLKQSQTELRKRLDGTDTTMQAADMVRRLDVLEGALGDLKAKQLSLDQKLSALITQSEENFRQLDALSTRTEEPPKPPPPKTATAKPVQPSDFETQAVLTPTASFNLAYNDYL